MLCSHVTIKKYLKISQSRSCDRFSAFFPNIELVWRSHYRSKYAFMPFVKWEISKRSNIIFLHDDD